MHAIQARFGPYRYRFTQSLVRTEMSELWIAEEQRAKEKIPKTVAVKIALLHSENRRTYSRANQLAIENEERWLTGFRNQHPNIVKLRQIAEEGSSERRVYRARSRMDGEPWFIVTDYLPGGDLNNLLKERRHLPASLALEIAEHVSSALDFIHTKNCVHCDIKTRNILFKAAPTGYRLTPETEPILIDFGIAKSASVEEQRVTGTPRWMPPEVREKMDRAEKQKPEATWDTYGLGLVLYSMLAGRVAHAGKESQQAWVRFEPEHFAADPSVADPAAMASGLNRLLERTTNDRPEERLSARELGVELQQLQRLTQTPVEIKPKASSTRKRWPVLVMMALLVASMVGAWFLLAPAGEAPTGPTPLVPTTVADGSGADGFGAPIKKPPGPSGGDEASGAIVAAVDTATATATPSNTATLRIGADIGRHTDIDPQGDGHSDDIEAHRAAGDDDQTHLDGIHDADQTGDQHAGADQASNVNTARHTHADTFADTFVDSEAKQHTDSQSADCKQRGQIRCAAQPVPHRHAARRGAFRMGTAICGGRQRLFRSQNLGRRSGQLAQRLRTTAPQPGDHDLRRRGRSTC